VSILVLVITIWSWRRWSGGWFTGLDVSLYGHARSANLFIVFEIPFTGVHPFPSLLSSNHPWW